MLVLTRKVGERILVDLPDGTRVEIVLVSTRYGVAQIGVEAPLLVKIMRPELLNRPPRLAG